MSFGMMPDFFVPTQSVPPSPSFHRFAWSSGRTHIEFLHRSPVNAARSIDYGRKRGTKCKFSAHGQGLALAVIQRQSAGRTQCETPTQSVPPSPSFHRFAWSSAPTHIEFLHRSPVNAARSIDYGRKRGSSLIFRFRAGRGRIVLRAER